MSLNYLALKKSPEFMRLFVAPEGKVMFSFDGNSLEPRIMAHATQDKTLLSVYGRNANPHADIYLTTGAYLSMFSEKIRKYYDPLNPTAEGVKVAKKECDKERKRSKTIYLGFMYGLGAETLSINENMDLTEAQEAIRDMRTIYAGIGRFHTKLMAQWAQNKGYIVNGRGMPLSVCKDSTKDLCNRWVQSTGVMLLRRITQRHLPMAAAEAGIKYSWHTPNIHDEAVGLYDINADRQPLIDCINEAFRRLNDELGWSVDIKHGGINFGDSLAIRCD
jgi:hypothetical protein